MELATEKRRLPPGVRFHPTDVELLLHYLLRMVSGKPLEAGFVAEVDIYKFHPAALKALAYFSEELNWYFFCSAESKYRSGGRKNRAAPRGYWKPTGNDRVVLNRKMAVGYVKTLVFHEGKPANGVRTDWVMHEYRLEPSLLKAAQLKAAKLEAAELGNNGESAEVVVCKIFKKGGVGPRNGEQFGAAYNEDEWNNALEPITEHGQSSCAEMTQMNENDLVSADAKITTAEQVQSDVVSLSVVNQPSTPTPNGANAASTSNGIAAPEIGQSSRYPVGDPVDGMSYPDDFGDLFDNLEDLNDYFTEEDFFDSSGLEWKRAKSRYG